MKRREFIALSAARPRSSRSQCRARSACSETIPRIGIIDDGRSGGPFARRYARHGYVEGQNHRYRISLADRLDRLQAFGGRTGRSSRPSCARDLRHPRAAPPSAASLAIPIVMVTGRLIRCAAGLGAEPRASGRQSHRQHHPLAGPWPGAAPTRQGDHSPTPRVALLWKSRTTSRYDAGDPRTAATRHRPATGLHSPRSRRAMPPISTARSRYWRASVPDARAADQLIPCTSSQMSAIIDFPGAEPAAGMF